MTLKFNQHKLGITSLMVWTLLIDIIWILIWGIFWNDKKYYPNGYWENTIHSFVLWLSALNICVKVNVKEFNY